MIERVVTVGEALAVFRAGDDGPLWSAPRVAVSTGGAEGNVAMALARRGVPVSWFGRVGDDSLGRRVVRELRAEGVDVHPVVDRENPTGLLVKELDAGGRTSVVYYRRGSAGSRLSPADVDRIPLTGATLVHLTGITPALSPEARSAVDHLLDRAKTAGATVSFDVNHRGRLWEGETAAPVYREIASRADVLFASLEEVPYLIPGWGGVSPEPGGVSEPGGGSSPGGVSGLGGGGAGAAAVALGERGYSHVVVTAGAAGAVAGIDGELYAVPAVPLDGVVDTVGAGDAFVGGYLAELVAGHGPSRRLRTGALLGAAACRHAGDWEGVADLSALDGEAAPDDPVTR
ncbi:sugar kinase [Cryptosporangium phraense]|uniref:Sugar kinase n=1 Tax=Cryptosporangium phraense TaxID=2593070 RepID=A0A545AIK6_9ACTN|nr:sugar kinase [Cryptosporangium phraense]TQS41151.1 sugar kinase [Cryptosporangium phraense]